MDVPAENLSFCRAWWGLAIQQIIKHTLLKRILATQKTARRERERERERERNTIHANQTIFGSVSIPRNELHVECFNKITPCYMFSTNPMVSLQNAGVPNLKTSPWDPVNLTTKCLAVEITFFKLPSIFIHGTCYFLDKITWFASAEVGSGPFHKVVSLENYITLPITINKKNIL